jgi:nucleotide-binding universal stress UspA family protein
MKTILCPTDFSKNSENAFRYALELAENQEARVLLMHAYETPVIYTDVTVSSVQLDFEVYRETAWKDLRKFYEKASGTKKGVRVELIVQQGLPSARTVEVAIEKKVDVIIMASSASSQMQRLLVGSNASRVLRDAPCTVLMIPSKAKFTGFKKIVYATDLSDENLLASLKVADLAKEFKAEMIYLNIDNKSLVHDDADLERITSRIRQFVHYPKMKGYVCTDLNIADGITYFLKNNKADCLSMATHHRKFFSAIAHPSITKRVSHTIDVPLLIVHTPDH